jgi:hypothetical protein
LIGSIIAAQAIHVASMYIPFLSNILQTSPVSFNSWMLLLAVAMTLMVVDELYKLWIRKGSKNLVLNITSIKTSNKSIDQPAQEITNIYDNQDG